ncbi:MAG: hypothetical protein PVI66_08795 [Candidatus Aminicenantes bacterium]|jgi:hypothetical protein
MAGENVCKGFPIFFVVFACVSFLHSQSLVDVAKKEKERRAALRAKGIISVVVTNVDLGKQRRFPMSGTQSQETSSQGRTQTGRQTIQDPSTRSISQQRDSEERQSRDVYGFRKNATKVLTTTVLTENPEFALDRPDSNYAEISFGGILDLELRAKNGPGDDILIYVRRSGTEGGIALEDGIPAGAEARAFPGALQFGVLVWGDSGDWEAIGKDMGINSPAKFDLGNNTSINRIRIIFRAFGNASTDLSADYYKLAPKGTSMGIDAVEALH